MTNDRSQDFESVVHERLDDQIAWYDRKARLNQHRYRISSVLQIALSAVIMIVAATATQVLSIPVVPGRFDLGVAALLAAVLAILKGMETAYQWQSNWINYRAAAESLKREKYLYRANAGPYTGAADPRRLLIERIEDVIAHETGGWTGRMQQGQPAVGAAPPKPGEGQ
ncbi:MAG TPA: DUF4231 domain-containing protein [Candidatus Elarobacter sp.]